MPAGLMSRLTPLAEQFLALLKSARCRRWLTRDRSLALFRDLQSDYVDHPVPGPPDSVVAVARPLPINFASTSISNLCTTIIMSSVHPRGLWASNSSARLGINGECR